MSIRQLVLVVFPFILLIVLGVILMPSHDAGSLKHDEDQLPQPILVNIATGAANLKELEEVFDPFRQFLNERLKFDGIQLNPVFYPTREALDAAIASGEVDLYLESAFPVYCAAKRTGIRPIARQWKNGVENYHSMILVKAGSGIRKLSELKGKLIALEDSDSSSSFWLPIAELRSHGLSVVENLGTAVSPTEVGYKFSQTDSVSIRWLLEGSVKGAAISSDYYNEIEADIGGELRIIHETRAIPRYLLAAGKDLPTGIEDRILECLLNLETYPEGQEAMKALWNTRRFDLIPYERDLRNRMFALIEILSCDP